MGRLSRQKGKKWEREVARRFREALGLPADVVKRGLGQARSAGEVPDVDGVPGYWPECKNTDRKHHDPHGALAQASTAVQESSDPSRVPVAICKVDRSPPTATMYLDDLVDLVHSAGGSDGSVPVTFDLDAFLRLITARR